MKYYYYVLSILFISSCNNHNVSIKNINSNDSLKLSIQGSWGGDAGALIWDIRPDSIFYYSENRSYYYFIHDKDIIVLYKNGPYKLENISVIKDTFFFKLGDMKAKAFKSVESNHKLYSGDNKNLLEDTVSYNSIQNKILGKWGYEHKGGIFSWVFSKDSICYVQLNKKYFYIQHENNAIVLTEGDPTIMKDIIVKSDTMYFTTLDGTLIKAHKLN